MNANLANHQRQQQKPPAPALSLGALDAEIVRYAWDAEEISREYDQPVYSFWPPMPGDTDVTAVAGAKNAAKLKHPVLIWKNSTEET